MGELESLRRLACRPRARGTSPSRPNFSRFSAWSLPAPGHYLPRLNKIVVKVIRLQDFHPSKATVEKGDLETVVGEFRQFLETAFDGDGAGQSTIVEIR